MQPLVPDSPHAVALLRAVSRRRDAALASMARAVADRAITLAALVASRAQVEASRALIERVRALGAGVGAFTPRASSRRAARPEVARARLARGERCECSFSGCALPTRFHPLFGVQRGDQHTVVRYLPVRVCADHRAPLEALLRSHAVRDWLRRRLRGLGTEGPDSIRVFFEVVG